MRLLLRTLPLVAIALSSRAQADALEVLGPAGAVLAEPFEIAVVRREGTGHAVPVREARLEVQGGRAVPVADEPRHALYRIEPATGATEISVRASLGALSGSARFPVGPPAAQVELSLEPARPVKGKDSSAELTVRLKGPEGREEDSGALPVIRANVGQVSPPVRVAPGVYRATYRLPETRYPEVAVLVALSAWPHAQSSEGAHGKILVPLATALDLTGQTERAARMTIQIGSETFGPVRAGDDGRFKIPVVIPPGERIAQGRAVDRVGNARRTPIDLMLPPTDGLACIASPVRVPADGRSQSRILCAASDPRGRPVPDAQVTAKAQAGVLEGPRRTDTGLLEWRYTAPTSFGAERITASWGARGGISREELPIELVQGPVRDVEWQLSEGPLHRGSSSDVAVRTLDALGRPRPGARVTFTASEGRLAAASETEPARHVTRWSIPVEGDAATAMLEAQVQSPPGAEPARLHAWIERRVRKTDRDSFAVDEETLWVGVSDLAGLAVPRQRLNIDGRTLTTGDDGALRVGPLRSKPWEIAHADWPALRERVHLLSLDGPVFPRSASLRMRARQKVVRLAPAVPVNVRVAVQGREVSYWAEDPEGRVLPDRALGVTLSAGEPVPRPAIPGRRSFVVPGVERVQVSIADLATGVTAVVEVGP